MDHYPYLLEIFIELDKNISIAKRRKLEKEFIKVLDLFFNQHHYKGGDLYDDAVRESQKAIEYYKKASKDALEGIYKEPEALGTAINVLGGIPVAGQILLIADQIRKAIQGAINAPGDKRNRELSKNYDDAVIFHEKILNDLLSKNRNQFNNGIKNDIANSKKHRELVQRQKKLAT